MTDTCRVQTNASAECHKLHATHAGHPRESSFFSCFNFVFAWDAVHTLLSLVNREMPKSDHCFAPPLGVAAAPKKTMDGPRV